MRETLALAEEVRRVVSVAHAMLASGRPVNLSGLDRSVGLLCAKALDLPPEEGRALAVELASLVESIAVLSSIIRESL